MCQKCKIKPKQDSNSVIALSMSVDLCSSGWAALEDLGECAQVWVSEVVTVHPCVHLSGLAAQECNGL